MELDKLSTHAIVWARMEQMIHKNRLPHALLLTGSLSAGILQFTHRLMACLLCHDLANKPCGHCKACHLLIQGTHPDIHYVNQDTPTSAIKIDQIRALQTGVYHTPQCGDRRFIVISPADRLNFAAANALLKILEEPPEHTMFILVADKIGGIPATILSRCQQHSFHAQKSLNTMSQGDYLAVGEFYPEESSRAVLFKQLPVIINAMCDYADNKISGCALAAQWASYSLSDVLWFLYLLNAEILRYHLSGYKTTSAWSNSLYRFAAHLSVDVLFVQLDEINKLTSYIEQNISLNATLTLEVLILGYGFNQGL